MSLQSPGTDDAADPKRARILEGAMKVFLAYGFSRTTMDDIARAADVSRPALYLLFKNKADIYRAIGTEMLGRTVEEARAALAADGPLAERLMTALGAGLFSMMKQFEGSPHGEELLDMKNDLAADILAGWREGMAAAIGDAIAAQAGDGVLEAKGLSPRGLADMLLDGLEGMKTRSVPCEELAHGARRFVTLIEIALRA